MKLVLTCLYDMKLVLTSTSKIYVDAYAVQCVWGVCMCLCVLIAAYRHGYT